ncbi:MAG: putative collagen-binding domain-containing protein [Terriglobales bacterium]
MSRSRMYGIAETPRRRGKAADLGVTGTLIVVTCFLLISACGLFAQTATAGSMSPLWVGQKNSHYFTTRNGKVVFLTGSHTWNDFQNMGTSISPTPIDFHAYVMFLKAHGQNVTILWKKDLPIDCGWRADGIWYFSPFPWKRTGGPDGKQLATNGLRAFDLSQFNQAYFDLLRARAIELQHNGVYGIVQLFDGLQLIDSRCKNDGYPYSAGNNVNDVDDGDHSGQTGTNSMTMTKSNAVVRYQDAYVKKVIDTLNDLPNVLWEVSEEAPPTSLWWQEHMIGLIHAYEAGGTWEGVTYPPKSLRHPVGLGGLQCPGNDTFLYSTAADWIAPSVGCTARAVAPPDNHGHVILNDSDHSFYYIHFVDSAGNVLNREARNYIWENFTNGAAVLFMDPYEVNWAPGERNVCPHPVNGICPAPDPKYDNLRDNLGYTLRYANRMNMASMLPHGSLASTSYCLANPADPGAEYLVFAPSGGTFTVNLSATRNTLNVEWFNPASGKTIPAGTVQGGLSGQPFTVPFPGDAVLYLFEPASTGSTR